ncbi:MAG TPA: hypothetical protein VL576_00075 [Candidatus Paceibacterota bacterium]|jgi:hypothetical protein|nr:hypothetical protein [Candidatus Paceibacterota bacterium]
MKKFSLIFIALFSFVIFHGHALAVDTIPNTSVWFTPSDAASGAPITLNALVYNNQTQDATVTVQFKTDAGVIGTQSALVASQSAKTLVQKWLMPAKATVVTASVTGAVDKNKKSIPALLGTLGTVSVGVGVTPVITTGSFPGSSTLTAWLGPLLSKIETFRLNQAVAYAALRDQTKLALGITPSKTPAQNTGDGLPPVKFDNPLNYIVLIYATAAASFFGSAIIFYIGIILVLLLLIRFIVNLIF